MQEIKINGNTIVYNSDNEIILKSGATLKVAQKSLARNAKLTALRASATTTDASGNLVTTCDLTFKNKSSIATFIEGNSRSGTEYFKKYLSATTTTIISSNEEENKTSEEVIEDREEEKSVIVDKIARDKLAKDIIAYAIDFALDVTPRLLNSLYYVKKPNDFILDYMRLCGYDETVIEDAKKKMSMEEWKNLIKTLKSLKPTHDRVNKRLIIKFGKAGTGKTTSAIAENPNAVRIVASASQDPDDLFTFFNPSTKKYELTELGNAMAEGKVIIIDEWNLYPQVVHTRLQGVLDNTEEITERGITIKIHKDFKVVATMNLETNFGKMPLPQPLVDRAEKIENYDHLQDLSWVW